MALSLALRDVIEMIELLKELQSLNFNIWTKPTIHCQLFEDNSGALEIARVKKYRPRTRHIAAQWHHFRQYVTDKTIEILSCPTTEQRADPATKQCEAHLFFKHRRANFGW